MRRKEREERRKDCALPDIWKASGKRIAQSPRGEREGEGNERWASSAAENWQKRERKGSRRAAAADRRDIRKLRTETSTFFKIVCKSSILLVENRLTGSTEGRREKEKKYDTLPESA